MSELTPGTTIDKYVLEEEIGRGGMGQVWKARHTFLKDLPYAIKVMLAGTHLLEERVTRFFREASVLATLGNHPHIVQIHDMGEFGDGQYYIAMAYVPNSLAKQLSSVRDPGDTLPVDKETAGVEQMDVSEAIRIGREICLGLQAAHDKGIIHRDLKPENVLLDEEGRPQICDFGIARLQNATGLTVAHAGMGSPIYTAPEVLSESANEADSRADIYSVGALLFRMATGEPPQINQDNDPLAINPDMPTELNGLIRNCLAPHEQRIARIEEVIGRLEQIADQTASSLSTVGRNQRTAETTGWFSYPEAAVEALSARLSTNCIFVDEDPIAGYDGQALLKQGLMSDIKMHRGQLVACTTSLWLLAAQHDALLRQWLESLPEPVNEEPMRYVFRQYFVYHNVTRARSELDKCQSTKFDLRPTVMLARYFREYQLAEQWLTETETRAKKNCAKWAACSAIWECVFENHQEADRSFKEIYNSTYYSKEVQGYHLLKLLKEKDEGPIRSNLIRLSKFEKEKQVFNLPAAKALYALLGDRENAAETIASVEQSAEDTLTWKNCAMAYLETSEDENHAKRCLQQAEKLAQNTLDWAGCASVWMDGLHDEFQTRQCLSRAEERADSVPRFLECSYQAMTLLNDANRATRNLEQAEQKAAHKIHDLEKCAIAWNKILFNETNARRCLEKIETHSVRNAIGHARQWMALFNDRREARRCLVKKESEAEKSSDWIQCAEGYEEILDDRDQMITCLRKAEETADTQQDWEKCAHLWHRLGEKTQTMRCVIQAENCTGDLDRYRVCAEMWMTFFEAKKEAHRCLALDEKRAISTFNWWNCAANWHKILGDVSATLRCLQQAEQDAKKPGDWVDCGRIWHECLDDRDEARRCLESAESIAGDQKLDLINCYEFAGLWKTFGGETARHEFLTRVEKEATSIRNWLTCADLWGGKPEEGTGKYRCIKQAENKAKTSVDWIKCAQVWSSNYAEYARCMKQAEAVVKTGWHWIECASEWNSSSSGKGDQIQRTKTIYCLKQAEAFASTPGAWVVCASFWHKCFRDKEGLKRCLENAVSTIGTDTEVKIPNRYMKCSVIDIIKEAESLGISIPDGIIGLSIPGKYLGGYKETNRSPAC